MAKDLADTLVDFYQQILKPDLDGIKGKQGEHDDRFTEICDRLQDLSQLLGQLENALSAAGLDPKAEKEIDPELKAIIEGP